MNESSLIEAPVVSTASWRQAGILVVDASPSMQDPVDAPEFSGKKGEAAGLAIGDLLSLFKVSRKAANFSFAGIEFAETVTHKWGPVAGGTVDAVADYNPLRHVGNGTSLAAGLVEAQEMTTKFLGESVDGLPASVVVLLLTDGECGTQDQTRRIAAQLTSDPRVTLACAFFATKGQPPKGLGLLREICSQPATTFCQTVYDPDTLRKFWQASMSAAAALPAGSLADDEL
jgi:hypothetical protein